MTIEELGKLLIEVKNSYNSLAEQIAKKALPAMEVEMALKIEGWKEGAQMAFVAICHTIASYYGVEMDIQLSDGQTLTVGELRHE